MPWHMMKEHKPESRTAYLCSAYEFPQQWLRGLLKRVEDQCEWTSAVS